MRPVLLLLQMLWCLKSPARSKIVQMVHDKHETCSIAGMSICHEYRICTDSLFSLSFGLCRRGLVAAQDPRNPDRLLVSDGESAIWEVADLKSECVCCPPTQISLLCSTRTLAAMFR